MIKLILIHGKEYFVDGVESESGQTSCIAVIGNDGSDDIKCKDGQRRQRRKQEAKRLSGKDKIV